VPQTAWAPWRASDPSGRVHQEDLEQLVLLFLTAKTQRPQRNADAKTDFECLISEFRGPLRVLRVFAVQSQFWSISIGSLGNGPSATSPVGSALPYEVQDEFGGLIGAVWAWLWSALACAQNTWCVQPISRSEISLGDLLGSHHLTGESLQHR